MGAWQFVSFHCPPWYSYETQLSFPVKEAGRSYCTSASPVVAMTFRTCTPLIRIESRVTPRRCCIAARICLRYDAVIMELMVGAPERQPGASMPRISATVPVRKALDQAIAAARRPAVVGSLGDVGALDEVEPVLQAAQIRARPPTTTQRLILGTLLC